jgi:hypothetical protein
MKLSKYFSFYLNFLNYIIIFILKSEISKELARYEHDVKHAMHELNHVEELKREAEGRKEDTTDLVNKEKNQNFDREKEFNDLTKQYELEREKEIVLQSDK